MKVFSTGYSPRKWQEEVHLHAKRFTVCVVHRRAGKTVLAVNHMGDRGLRNPRVNPQYAYIAPYYSQAKRIAWDYFKNSWGKAPGALINEADLRIDIPRPWAGDRVRFMLLGADNPDSLRGLYLDGVVCDEFGEWNPRPWREVIFPALLDREGWALLMGTPKGRNLFYDLYEYAKEDPKNWARFLFDVNSTQSLSPDAVAMAKQSMSIEEFEQEMLCSFAAGMVGAIFGRQMVTVRNEIRIRDVPHDPSIPVDTFWDLGRDGMPIIFAQTVGQEIRLIDYIEEIGSDLPTVVRMLKERPYVYGEHVLPHDGRAKELGTGRSREETLRSLGLQSIRVLDRQSKEDSINAGRLILNRCYFDKIKCSRLVEALEKYSWSFDKDRQIFSKTPLHNQYSHGADAFQQLAMGIQESHHRHFPSNLPLTAETEYDVFKQ